MESVSISGVRAVTIRLNPFWGYLLAQTPVDVREGEETSWTDGRRIVLASQHAKDRKMAVKVLLHELAHIGYMHVARRKNRDYVTVAGEEIPALVCNLAEDVVANGIVKDITGEDIENAAVVVPEGTRGKRAIIRGVAPQPIEVQFPRKIAEMTTEEIIKTVWETVKKYLPPTGGGGSGGSGSGDGQDGRKKKKKRGKGKCNGEQGGEYWSDDHTQHGNISEGEKERIRQKIRRAAEYARKSRGTVPAGIEWVVEAMKPRIRVDWRTYTEKWVRETWGMDDYTWKRPNKRKMAATGVYLPRTVGYEGKAWIVLDTSGSMEGMMSMALGAIQRGMIQNGVREAVVIEADAAVEKVQRVRAEKLRRYVVRGGGGTVLRPAIEYAIQHGARGVIVITDGYIDVQGDLGGWRVPILVMALTEDGAEAIRRARLPNVRVVRVK